MKAVIVEPLGIEREKLFEIVEERLPDLAVDYYDTRTTDEQELIRRGKDAELIVVANQPVSEGVLEGWTSLKMLSVAFTGVDHIPMELCRKRGITVCNCAGYATAAVAELVFGMLIALYRNILPCNQRVRNAGTKEGLLGPELEGKRFGVVGTGAIGLRTAKIAQAFGCQVYAYSRTKKEMPGIQYVPLDELMSLCDVVSLHIPLNAETKNLIHRERIARMKPDAVLINTARGGVLDSQALAEALKEGKLAGACIDVFETEPPIERQHPLVNCPNTILTPHIAFASREALVKRAGIAFGNIVGYLEGKPRNVIEKGTL